MSKLSLRRHRSAIFLFIPLYLWATKQKKQNIVTKSIQTLFIRTICRKL